tara:strand:- start:872 stop:1885 length:1014 start_codon:yes stop_codon:yes gene_type:complete
MDLTKNLYFKNDVKWALYYSMLNKNEDQTIFWLCEYYESGYENESWEIIFVYYCCYYAKYYPYIKKNIDKEYKKWLNNKNVEHLLKIVFLLFKKTKKDDTFYKLLTSKVKRPEEINTNIDENMIKSIESKTNLRMKKKYKDFIKSLKEKHIQNIWINIYVLDFEKSYKIAKAYFEILDEKIGNINTNINFKKTRLFLEIYNKINNIKSKKCIMVKPKKEVMEKYNSYLNINKDTPTIDILKVKRVFKIPDGIIEFDCFRKKFSEEELRIIYLDEWMYHCRNTPYWKKIFEKYNITFDDEKEPMFENDDIEDEFCNKYYLDPDEQPTYVHEKSNFTLK